MIEALPMVEEPLPQEGPPQAVTPEDHQDRASVTAWLDRIARAKSRWEPDFQRMREDMEFMAGLQWPGQATLKTERYVVPLALRLISQKVASLYAKDPTAVATRRPRRDFSIWDGRVETLIEAANQAAMFLEAGAVLPPELEALFMDIEAGRLHQQHVEDVGDTLEKLYAYAMASQKPEFKEQMKQAVIRTCVCGVSYVRPVWCTEGVREPSTISHENDLGARAKEVLNSLDRDGSSENDARYADLRAITYALGGTPDIGQLPQRLEFDFPPATSIIVDPRCRNLVDFVAARWIAQEYILPIAEVNAIFGTNIRSRVNEPDEYNQRHEIGVEDDLVPAFDPNENIFVYEVFDYTTKTRFFVTREWPTFLLAPEPPTPACSGFWQHFALVFNKIEVEPGGKLSIFPPSDIHTIRCAQLEWNRTRDALRDQRNANAPKYIVRKGVLTDNDKAKLTNAEPNSVIEIEGVPPEMDLAKAIVPFQFAAIDPNLYDTAPLEQDIYMGGGMQQSNIGPAQPNVTATVGSIAEQARLTVSASNIDDLDGLLSRLAQASGEIFFQVMPRELVETIVGPGAVWPEDPMVRLGFMNEVLLKIEAASSGRPNKAIEVANARDLTPLLLQAGANPVGVVDFIAKRLDDNIDVTRFFPLTPPSPVGGAAGPQDTTDGSASSGSPIGEPPNPSPAAVRDSGPGAPPPGAPQSLP